jgi:hypothetical protein
MATDQSDADVPSPPGFPFINYAQRERNLSGIRPLHIPRPKYTFLVEFELNSAFILSPEQHVTNIVEFLPNGKLFTMLKTIDHPKPTMDVETLRSYNKYIKIPKKVEHPGLSMTFDDDSTSIAIALWKEHLNFYSHIGDIGSRLVGRNTNLFSLNASNSIQENETLIAAQGGDVRNDMNIRPSLGLRLKPNNKRTFFELIKIYDLGTEPDSVNVYYYHKPVITSWDHQNLDKEDRSGKVEVTASFEFENYYFLIGQNRQKLADIIQLYLGFLPDENEKTKQQDAEVHNAHGLTKRPSFFTAQPVEASSRTTSVPTPKLQSTDLAETTQPPQPVPQVTEEDIQKLEEERTRAETESTKIFERSGSGFSDNDRQKVDQLRRETNRLTNEINTARAAIDTFERSQVQNAQQASTVSGTASSLTNAQKKFGI